MAKLYFRYGTVGSAKTLNLLAVAHNYEQQGKRPFLIKPAIDTRFGQQLIKSRAGLEKTTHLLVDSSTILTDQLFKDIDCILVDEAQFLAESVIEQLRDITCRLQIPVICYGLRTDFRSRLFDGSRRLMEVADSIEEIKTTCAFCNRKAVFNMKIAAGTPTLDGPSIDLGTEEKYLPTCYTCYQARVSKASL